MGFPRRPRPRPTQASSSGSSSQSGSQRSSKRLRLTKDAIFNPEHVKIFIITAKLTPDEVRDLTRKAEENGALVVSRIEDANIVVSKTKLWNRLKKYLPDADINHKRIVLTEWLEDSISSGAQKPFSDAYVVRRPSPLDRVNLDDAQASIRSVSPTISDVGSIASTATVEPSSDQTAALTEPPSDLAIYPTPSTAIWAGTRTAPPKWRNKRFACERWHPLICVNQSLLQELKHIKEYNRMEGEERRSATYGKAMAAIKAYPYLLRSVKEAAGILGVGTKIAAQCGEFIAYGRIEAAERIKNSERQQILLQFCKIHGVGPSTARELYERYKCRTIEDVEQHAHVLPSMGEKSTMYVDEFDIKIPRAEVEEIADIVDQHLQRLIPGAEYTIVGGYRRGKAQSNDVDIVFTHPEAGREKGALQNVLKTLTQSGYVTEVLYQAFTDSQRDASMQHFHASHMDPLDKAFTVWLSPANGTDRPQAIHRRVDLIAAPARYYACAVLGWSGSTTFERDLRHYADRVKGYKFDSGGLWRRSDSKEIIVNTEEDVFEVLGLEYIPPEWRNADV